MGYIIKDNQGLLVTRLTDLGRRKISEGNFKISYFQIGDSEVSYTAVDNYTQQNSYVLEPPFNAQNNVGVPQSTKNDIKYPFYLNDVGSTTYGLPFMASTDDEVYNSATVLGFFSSCTSNFFPLMDTGHCYSANRAVTLTTLNDGNNTMIANINNTGTPSDRATSNPSANTFVTLFSQNASTAGCSYQSCKPTYRFKVTNFNSSTVTVDRIIPNLNTLGFTGFGRLIFTPSGMTGYDTPTPLNYWSSSVTNFESICTPDDGYVQIWNMNIPWSENPAGLTFPQLGYNDFGSVNYNGTKEYLGYSTYGGQVFYDSTLSQTASTDTWFYNINLDKVFVEPQDQKAIAIVHYTNNSIINYYGEKFATNVLGNATGDARNLVIDIPWVMWHKNTNCCNGLKLYIDPPGFNLTEDLLTPNYIQSTKNLDMNSPGMRYYHLWDTNPNSKDGGKPNRVGKVFPDDKMIVFDDDELVAIFNGKSNRSFTLPAPIVRGKESVNGTGLLSNEDDCVWVTYGFGSTIPGYQYLHCNYYQKVTGPKSGCTDSELDIILSFSGQNFANELNCLNGSATDTGYTANQFFVLIQKGSTSQSRPTPGNWRKVDLTTEIVASGYISSNDLVNATTLLVDLPTYQSSPLYDLNAQINGLPTQAMSPSSRYNFGDDYSFFGNITTDITATIYEMRYLINLPYNQFLKSSNPTWSEGIIPYITEIGLYDENKNLLVLGKVQSPTIRQGSQQWNLKLDF